MTKPRTQSLRKRLDEPKKHNEYLVGRILQEQEKCDHKELHRRIAEFEKVDMSLRLRLLALARKWETTQLHCICRYTTAVCADELRAVLKGKK